MKKICSNGFKISSVDQKALAEYLLVTPLQWAQSALKGMVNKAVKTIMRDYYEKYKETQEETVSADLSVVIPAIIAMAVFVPYNHDVPEEVQIQRKQEANQEIWPEGFQVEDYEEAALKAYYTDPEAMLQWFMANKILQRKKAFVKEHEQAIINDPDIHSIPAKQDDFIDMVTARDGYKNRIQQEQ